jgi:DNA-binding transcriptional ArsR family regulator
MTPILSKGDCIRLPEYVCPKVTSAYPDVCRAEVGVSHPALLPSGDEGVGVVAKSFRALGDPTRLRLLEFLLSQEHTVGECVDHVRLAQSRVAAHLACLADCGFVTCERRGRRTYYRVADPRLAHLVHLARSFAADNAAALADCMRIP